MSLICNSNGEKIPPVILFKISKPRNKSYNDNPETDYPKLNAETKELIRKSQALVIQNYSGWVTNYVMLNHLIPHLKNHLGNKYKKGKTLLIYDNFSAHVSEPVEEEYEKNGLHYLPLPPNCTKYLQPLDS